MKWYNKKHRDIFRREVKQTIARGHRLPKKFVIKYAPLAFKYAQRVSTDEKKSGVLNAQDVEQIAFIALIESWKTVNWGTATGVNSTERTLINYLSSNITGRLKKGLLEEATGVKIPQWVITRDKHQIAADSLFGNWMFSFRLEDFGPSAQRSYIDAIEWRPDTSSWDNDELNDKLMTIMQPLRQVERDIIMWSFGISQKFSMKKIAEKLGMSLRGVEDAKRKAIRKLNTPANAMFLHEHL